MKTCHIHHLEIFHHSCIRAILGISRTVQWRERLSFSALAQMFGMSLTMADLLRQHRMRWLGHVAGMDTGRVPKPIVFGELPGTRPRHGPKKRRRDVIVGDLVSRHVPLGEWYTLAQHRSTWRDIYRAFPPATRNSAPLDNLSLLNTSNSSVMGIQGPRRARARVCVCARVCAWPLRRES